MEKELQDLGNSEKLDIHSEKESSVDYLSTRLKKLSFLLELHHGESSNQLPRARKSLGRSKLFPTVRR